LGVKQLQENPWDTISDYYTSGKNIKGKAIKIINKSVIFELEYDVEGILNTNNQDAFNIGDEYDLTVQNLDMESKKVVIMDDGNDSDTPEEPTEEVEDSQDSDTPEEPTEEVEDSQDSDTPVDPSED